jgi:hypothetical protein
MTIKELLGDAYREDMTIAEIESALAGKKLADLSTGEYVSKKKYDDEVSKRTSLETKITELENKAPQVVNPENYDNDMQELATLRNEKKANEYKAKIRGLGVNEQFIEYVAKSVEDGENFDNAFNDFKTKNPFICDSNFKSYNQPNPNQVKGDPAPTSLADAIQQHYNK